ncbi:restriction endonuclease subunit S [Polaribacter sp. SA4-12]|uniref:restriction endonuclease subunit S n=1 Tax=Polaribacter sp. SA4-12 TaxID=1312072 RepID=UPI000B3C2792|nr:restriction endonuclease subunit S [Polaribacter sp. SA4-12]ARV14151.1 hypothetical protein BTO07_02840 [Polaribacter sp. SA4-12]
MTEQKNITSLRGTKQSVSLIPKLRFKEFEGDWDKKKMIDLSERIGDGLHGTPKYADNSEISFINGNNLIDGKVFITEKTKKVDKTIFLKNDKNLRTNTLLISLNGTIGNIARYNNEKVMLGKSVGYFNFKENSNYYYHVLKSPKIQRFFISELTGSTIKNLSLKTLRETNIPFPSVKEQQKIASFLTSVDTQIQQLTTKKQLLENYKKGVMQQLFSQQLRFKNDDGLDFPDWEEKKFSKFIKLYRGSSPRPIIRYTTSNENGVNWIKIGDTKKSKNYRINKVSEKITEEGSLKSRFVKKGEIILANSMSFGKSYLLEIEGCIYDGWFVLREYEDSFNKEFLLHILNSHYLQKQYLRLSTGGVVQNISSEIVYSTKLFRPSIKEQQKIANYLSAIDTKIENVQIQIEKTQAFKKGLLQQMFV